jgi:hypothetical protein
MKMLKKSILCVACTVFLFSPLSLVGCGGSDNTVTSPDKNSMPAVPEGEDGGAVKPGIEEA